MQMSDQNPIPADLSWLRRLVIALLLVMIVGFVTLIILFVMRFSELGADPVVPPEITLPDGTTPLAFTQGPDWIAIVTQEDTILIYDRDGQTLRQTLKITR